MTASTASAPPGALVETRRYAMAAIVLHWTIALLIVVQVFLGWWMNEWVPDHSAIQDQIQDVHISLGVTILILVLVRIGIRIAYRPPPVPSDIPGWERPLINITHTLFYALMLLIPLTGWALVSIGRHPITVWGLPWPHLPGLDVLRGDKPARHTLKSIHTFWLIWLLVINFTLHVAGALWHQFDGRSVFWRMLPGLKPPAAS